MLKLSVNTPRAGLPANAAIPDALQDLQLVASRANRLVAMIEASLAAIGSTDDPSAGDHGTMIAGCPSDQIARRFNELTGISNALLARLRKEMAA